MKPRKCRSDSIKSLSVFGKKSAGKGLYAAAITRNP